ncbi:uncharacterized protein LOC142638081 [Castanea sativa]|uniref:uncharacterized protein LOC142638081 n=1 Tax=Castanea sativa TaxID=21020 RepID=UPI003F64A42C
MRRNLTQLLRSHDSVLSRHAVLVAGLCGIFFAFVDFMDSVNNGRFTVSWSVYVSLLVCLNAFSFGPASCNKLINWFAFSLIASGWHRYALSTSHSVTTSLTMSLESKLYTFFLSTFASSILCLFAFHYIIIMFKLVLQKIFTFEARKQPGIWTILHDSAVVSVACCVFMSQCRETLLEQRYWKEKFCSFWLIPVEFAYCDDRYCYPPKIACSESPAGSADETCLRLWPWATFICVYIVSYVVMPLKSGNQQNKPGFLAMSHWYSGTSPDLYKTVFDMVTTNIIQTRFDMRILQAALNQREDTTRDYLYDHFSGKEELWFDFMADTGDGGDSTYTVARLLAQPKILNLKRGNLLLIGGDLAYPNPSESTYERRLFRPFQYALQPPPNHDERMTTNKPVLPPELPEPDQDVPQCFAIPGNHDWFDGLCTFMRNICHRSWLGGWYMPQKKSYFALKLPKGWWIFGLDLALSDDIDVYQFEFFTNLAKDEERVGQNDSVIIMTHKPNWLVDWYENGNSRNNVSNYQSKGKNVRDLIRNIKKEKCKLQIAGDIHHCMHHTAISHSNGNNNEPIKHLLVNGCGGAFTHPTHTFCGFRESGQVSYKCEFAYPSFKESRQCELDHTFQTISASSYWSSCFAAIKNAFIYILEDSNVSLGSATLLLIVAVAIVPSTVSFKNRVMIGATHVFVHLAAALSYSVMLEVSIVGLVQSKTLQTSAYHSRYRSYHAMSHRELPVPISILDRIVQWVSGLYQAYIKYFMSAFDVPELLAVSRSNICNNGIESASRWDITIYYASTFLYVYIFSTLTASLILGIYLCICSNCFNLYYDEAFSSLRIADYKAFTRFHINSDGDLEVFTLAVDKVPREWELEPNWKRPTPDDLSHRRENPSKWKASEFDPEPLETVKIIDKFVIRRTNGTATEVPGTEQNSSDEKKQKETETTLETEGKTNVDQTVAAKEIQEVEEKQSEAK